MLKYVIPNLLVIEGCTGTSYIIGAMSRCRGLINVMMYMDKSHISNMHFKGCGMGVVSSKNIHFG